MRLSRTFSIFLLLSSISISAWADWEAGFSASGTKKGLTKASGKVFLKEGMIRVDLVSPAEFILYAKSGVKQVAATVPSFRMRLTTDLSRFAGQIPTCLSKRFEDCVKEFHLKKIRDEKCGTHECEVYSGNANRHGIRKIELWHWKGESEPILSKSIVTKKDGSVILAEFTDITRKSHELSFFNVPEGYVNAGSLDRFLGDLKGESE